MNIIFYVIGGLFAFAFIQKTKNNTAVNNLNSALGGNSTGSDINSSGGIVESNYSNGEVDIFGAQRPDRFNMGDYINTYGDQRGLPAKNSDGSNTGNGGRIFNVTYEKVANVPKFIADYNDADFQTDIQTYRGKSIASSWAEYQRKLSTSKWGKNKPAIDRLTAWKNTPEAIYAEKGFDINHPNDSDQVGTIISDGKTAGLLVTGLTGNQGVVNPFDMTVSVGSDSKGDAYKYAEEQYLKYNLGQYVLTAQTGNTYIKKSYAIIKGYTITAPSIDKSLVNDTKNFGLPVYQPTTTTNTSKTSA